MLELRGVVAGYGGSPVLKGVNLTVGLGQTRAVLGANGAGKTTLLKTISNLVSMGTGSITFEGRDITRWSPHRIARAGVIHVPEGRRLFADLTVEENLVCGTLAARGRPKGPWGFSEVIELFPALERFMKRKAGSISGGEQQMVAVARALMANPLFLLLDEPSLGLAPAIADTVFAAIRRITTEHNVGVLLVEQSVDRALDVVDYAYVLQLGVLIAEGQPTDRRLREAIVSGYGLV